MTLSHTCSAQYEWAAGVYLLGMFVVFTTIASLVLKYKQYALSVGTRRIDTEGPIANGNGHTEPAAIPAQKPAKISVHTRCPVV